MINPKIEEDVLGAVDSLKDELVQLVCDAVKMPSVTPGYPGEVYEQVLGGETKVAEFFKPLLEDIGLETDMWEEEKGRANLVGVCRGTGEGKSLIFNGHTDVVPPGSEKDWTKAKPWSGKIAEGKIWGRGACDMKGGDAAALIAIKAFLKAGYKPKGDVILEYVIGEEMMDTPAGTGATIKRGYKADAAIVVEPSAPPLHMRYTVKGKATHACVRDELIRPSGAGVEIGVSSIDKALIIYDGLRKLEEEWGQTKSHPMFTRPGHFTLNPGGITSYPNDAFVISNESKIEYSIWHAPQDSPEQVKKEVEDQIRLFAQTDPWLRENPPKVEWLLWWPPFDVSPDAPICKAVAATYEKVIGESAKYYGFAGVNDGAFLNIAGIPTITIGPGNLCVAHAANEYVEISELVDAAKIYALSIAEWCGVRKANP